MVWSVWPVNPLLCVGPAKRQPFITNLIPDACMTNIQALIGGSLIDNKIGLVIQCVCVCTVLHSVCVCVQHVPQLLFLNPVPNEASVLLLVPASPSSCGGGRGGETGGGVELVACRAN